MNTTEVPVIRQVANESSAASEASVIRYRAPNSLQYNIIDSKTGVLL